MIPSDFDYNLRDSLMYDGTGLSFIVWCEKNDYILVKKDTLLTLLMSYDLEIKKVLLNYGLEHSLHGKICEDLSEIRNIFLQQIKTMKQ